MKFGTEFSAFDFSLTIIIITTTTITSSTPVNKLVQAIGIPCGWFWLHTAPMADTEPRKRRRPAKSCEQCRQRKVRCDRNVPCGPCTRARSSLGCSYRRDSRFSTPTDHQASPIISREPQRNARSYPLPSGMPEGSTGSLGETLHIEPRCGSKECISSQLGSTIRDLQLRLQRLEERLTDTDIVRPSAPEPDIQQALRELCDKVQRLEQRLLSCTDSPQAPKGELSIAATPPRLHTSSRKMKLFGPTHYMHTMDKLQLVGSLETRGPQPLCPELKAELTARTKELRLLRGSVKAAQSPRLNDPVPDLLSTIPTRSVCDELVQCYLRTFERVYRIVHIPSFNKEYQQFWDQPLAAPTPFLMKLALILAIGTTFHPQRGKAGKEYDTRLIQTWIYAAQWWLTGPAEKNTFNLDGLQIFCLLLLARQMGSPGPSLYLSAGSLLQTATAMGLHRDSAYFPFLPPFQSEMRARLWATVLELTLQSSLDSASPITIPYFDTKPPSNFNDTDINPDIKPLPNPHPSTTHTDTSLQLLLNASFSLRAETIHLIHSPDRIPYQKALYLATKLRTTCHTITTFFQSNTTTITTSPFHKSHLLTTLNRYILHLHLPFAHAASTTPQYHYSRKLCLESALTIASFAPSSSTSIPIPLDDFPLLTLTARGPLRGPLNLDIICTLALELITQIEEAPAVPNTTTAPNPLTLLSSTIRAPILQTLENLALQSAHVLRMHGKSPALKRYIISEALVAQIRALEDGGGGGDVQGVVYEAVRGCLREGVGMLKGMEREGRDGDGDVGSLGMGMMVTPDSAGGAVGGSDGMGLGIGIGMDDLEGWGLASFLYAPGFMDLGGW
ncbi:transcriptional regulator family: Fungal Specific TF [Aspergillus niger]|nr:transcriptional regulator family: Fungal Specific TF [Aspergillus niger]KAI2976054.1 transcriptional regulator family: Fungal Specific TF [Aspergillus niger]KAI3016101.1 transcriptional regulator family: Fungal Specific TF [Aspergillus niger]